MKVFLRALFGVSALAILITAAPVLAAEVDVAGDNVDTGASSNNDNDFDVESEVELDVDNNGEVDNEADVEADTGHNDQNKNTNAGDLETGEVDATGDWESVLNEGAALVGTEGDLDVETDFVNDTTGADSDNDNDLDVDYEVELELDNVADIWNDLDFDAETGYNDQNKNTNAGDMETGGASLDTEIVNEANNEAGFAAMDGYGATVDVTAENNTTGADSDNNNNVDVEAEYELEVDNDAEVDNEIDVEIDTGHNDQNKNTNAGDLVTGDGEVEVATENVVNNGSGASGDLDSGLDVSADLTNDTTGADSDNDNDLDVEHEVEVDVENDAEVNNEVDAEVDTGHNDQNKNTNAGSTETGDVHIDLSFTSEVNSN